MKTEIKNIKKVVLSFAVAVVFMSYIIYQQGGKGISSPGNNIAVDPSVYNGNKTAGTLFQAVYKDGQYTEDSVNAAYGNVQVAVTVSGGKITDVQFLDHPKSRSTSVGINNYAMPILKSEAIQSQSAHVNTVTGATYTSAAFINSLTSSLLKSLILQI
jgi:uncharacterized protein with FMN-binding domain